jgi:hypothetical protein
VLGGDHRRHGKATSADLARQVEVQPARLPRREHRDDHLIESEQVQRILDRRERLVLADDSVHSLPGSPGQRRQRLRQACLGFDDAVIPGIGDTVKAARPGRHPAG